MKINNIPENVGEYLKYDETSPSGLRWIKARQNINVGDPAGSFNNRRNYYNTNFDGKKYLNHRVIFFLHHGFCPSCIDHIDGDTQNNRIDNLREASRSQNQHNSKIRKNNSSGHKGVSLQSGKYWYVQIRKNRKFVISKLFPLSEFQAACDYADEQRAVIHGEFSNNGHLIISRKSSSLLGRDLAVH